jgi:F-type H+-transporting ATPase subunit delta
MTLAMKASSRQSLAAARNALEKKLTSADIAATTARELLAMVVVFDSNISLSRALTDRSRTVADKSELIKRVFANSVSEVTLSFANELIALRWSSPSDLVSAIERLGIETDAAAAEKNNSLDRLEEELFAFTQTVRKSPELRATLNVRARTGARKSDLIAHVKSAVALTPDPVDRIAKSLSAQIGTQVRVNVEIDSTVVGGLSIRFGDEVIDGSIATRIGSAQRLLAERTA